MTRLRYTVRPKHGSILEFLLRYALEVRTTRPESNKTDNGVWVATVKRPYGPEAIICVDYITMIEVNALAQGPLRWFLVPHQHLQPFLKGQVIK